MQYIVMDFRLTSKLRVQFSKITEKDLHEITEKARLREGLDLVAPRISENSKTSHTNNVTGVSPPVMNNFHSVAWEHDCQ
jgi:hypothetical protein